MAAPRTAGLDIREIPEDERHPGVVCEADNVAMATHVLTTSFGESFLLCNHHRNEQIAKNATKSTQTTV